MDELLFFGEDAFSMAPAQERELAKALDIDYSMGTTDQTGASALRKESLDSTLKWVEANENSPAFWKAVKKGKATSAVEEFAILNELGDAASYSSGDLPEEYDEDLKRDFEQVKLVGAVGKVPYFAQANDIINGDLVAQVTKMKTVAMLRKLDVVSLFGDASLLPTDPNGIVAQAIKRMKFPEQNVIDKQGKRLTLEDFNTAGKIIADNYGNSMNLKIWMGNDAYKNYVDELIASKTYFLNGGAVDNVYVQARNLRIGSGGGNIETDVFMRHRGETFLGASHPKLNKAGTAFASMSDRAPNELDSNTCSLTIDALSGSSLPAATYDYAIVPVNKYGAQKAFELTGNVVAASKKVTFTISDNGSPDGREADKFDIYRKITSGTTKKDYKYLTSFAAAATTKVDNGAYVPGTTTVLAIDWDFDQVLRVDQLGTMSRLPLAIISDAVRWLQKIYFTPKVFNGSKIVIFKNVGATANA